MNNKFNELLLGDIAELGDGAHSKVNRVSNGVLYLTSKNIKKGFLDLTSVEKISEYDFERLFSESSQSIRSIKADDILIGIIGSFGNSYLVKENDKFGASSSVGIIRPNPELVNPKYLYYYINSNRFKKYVNTLKGGSVQGYTNLPTLRNIPIPIPPMIIQESIVELLQSIDEKINNSIELNNNLTELSKNLFKQWFLLYEFPNKDGLAYKSFGGEMIESELGHIPKGWYVSNIFENIIEVSQKNKDNNKLPVLSVISESRFTLSDEYFKDQVYSKDLSKYKIINKGEVGFNPSRANIGSIAMLKEFDSGLLSPMYKIFKANDKTISKNYIQCYMMQDNFIPNISFCAFGTVRITFNLEYFKKFKIVIPPMSLLNKFDEIIDNINTQIETYESEIKSLTELRDLFITELMSGKMVLQ